MLSDEHFFLRAIPNPKHFFLLISHDAQSGSLTRNTHGGLMEVDNDGMNMNMKGLGLGDFGFDP